MSTVTVQIVLHGLIALAPIPMDSLEVNRMAALLVEAAESTLPQDMPADYKQCIKPHQAQIAFPTDSSECVESVTGCKLKDSTCTCPLKRHEILIEPDTEPNVRQQLKRNRPPRSLPLDRDKAIDFAYIANLSSLPGLEPSQKTIRPDFITSPSPPRELAARFIFPFKSLFLCDFSSRRDDRADNIHPLNFRALKDEEQEGELSQALAQILVTTANFEDNGTGLTLRLHPFDGGIDKVFKLKRIPSIRIRLSNTREHFLRPDELCDDGIARDFALFYQLTQTPPDWNIRPVPHIKYTIWKSAADIEHENCKGITDPKAPMDRPICPMASFNP